MKVAKVTPQGTPLKCYLLDIEQNELKEYPLEYSMYVVIISKIIEKPCCSISLQPSCSN